MKRSSRPAAAPLNRLLLATLLLLAFAGSIGVATVWLRHEVSAVAQSTKQTQARIADFQRHTAETNAQIAASLNPERLLAQNSVLRLGLTRPSDRQIVPVKDAEVLFASKSNADRIDVQPVSLHLR
jgi:hypothetical protein